MNMRITMSEQKRTWLTLIGIVALCVAGVLTLLTPSAPHSILGSVAWKIATAAAGLVGLISFWTNVPMSGKLGVARAVQQRKFGTALVFAVIYLAFATILFWSVYSSSEEIKFAGSGGLWFSLAFLRGSRYLLGRT